MDLELVVCVKGSSRRCRGRVVMTLPALEPRCPHCRGEIRPASKEEIEAYRARLDAEAQTREGGAE